MPTSGATVWYGEMVEGAGGNVLARLVSLDGTGSEYAPGEGNV